MEKKSKPDRPSSGHSQTWGQTNSDVTGEGSREIKDTWSATQDFGHANDEQLTDELPVGSVIAGQYKILSKLGVGGMSHVYRCEDLLINRIIAVKVMRMNLSLQPQAATRFQREAKVVAMLEHRNIVKLYALNMTEDKQPFIVMEMVEGESLASIIEKQKTLPLPRVLTLVMQICDALEIAHAHGIVHRDLKPSNIMITNQGKPNETIKVLDFGIAKLGNDASVKTTQTGEIFGSPAYMSPEQALAQNVDEKSDQYSLGCVVFELLTGRTPFVGENFLPMIMAHVNEKAPTLSRVSDKRFPAPVERTVARLLEKKPEDRFASISEAKESLLGKAAPVQKKQGGKSLVSTRSLILGGTVIVSLLVAWSVVGFLNPPKVTDVASSKHYQPGNDNGIPIGELGGDDAGFLISLNQNPNREIVDLSKQPNITDAGLHGLLSVHSVKRLSLRRCQKFTNASMKYLLGLPLIYLDLHETPLDDSGMKDICQIKTLLYLDVCDTDVSDKGCVDLPNLSNLRVLRIHKTPITGRALDDIVKIPKLRELDASFTEVHENLGALKQTKLKKLELERCLLTNESLKNVAQLPLLVSLSLRGNDNITDDGLLLLKSLKNLRVLFVGQCHNLTPQGIAKLKAALPGCHIQEVDTAEAEVRQALDAFRE